MKTASQYRQRAREILGGNIFSNQWIYAVIVALIFTLATGSILSLLFSAVTVIFAGPILMGYSKYFLGIARKDVANEDVKVLIDGFRGNIGQNVVTGLLIKLYTFLWSLLFVIPGIVKSYSYSMTYYIRCDHPEYSAKEAIAESERIMQGNRLRLFLLQLSFIGWIIVGAFCFGVGGLWVNSYMKTAEVEFYRDLVEKESKETVKESSSAEENNAVNA